MNDHTLRFVLTVLVNTPSHTHTYTRVKNKNNPPFFLKKKNEVPRRGVRGICGWYVKYIFKNVI